MKDCDQLVEINHNPSWPYIPEHPYKTLIIGGSGSGKIDVLLNLIKNERPDFDKIYFYVKRSIRIKVSIVYQWKRESRK